MHFVFLTCFKSADKRVNFCTKLKKEEERKNPRNVIRENMEAFLLLMSAQEVMKKEKVMVRGGAYSSG